MMDCPDLAVPPEVMQHVVNVESARNPFAIGVVGGYLAKQPSNLDEALAAVRQLKQEGYNFSVGIAQVNRYNLAKYGLPDYASAFQACPNLKAGSRILRECYDRAQEWGKAFSCYYSGNFVTGFDHGYVQKIFASIRKAQYAVQDAPKAVRIIPYNSKTQRKIARDDGLPMGEAGKPALVAAPRALPAATAPYPEPYAVRRYLPSTPLAVTATALNNASALPLGASLSTAESRPAIPVPGPGALMPESSSATVSGLADIPVQVVGVDGDPYKTRLLTKNGPQRAGGTLPLPDPSMAVLPGPSAPLKSTRGTSRVASEAAKGGSLISPGQVDSKVDRPIGGGTEAAGDATKNVAENLDRSFVF